MSTKFTPGPWHQFPKQKLCIESSDGNIALCNLARCSNADAALIADAPAMYALLRKLVDHVDQRFSGNFRSFQEYLPLKAEVEALLARHQS